MAFIGREKTKVRPATILDLYNELPRTKQAVKNLWVHQGQIVTAYVEDHSTTDDLALEMPTGTGKTLPGLLICEWERRGPRGRVVYACPTNQLARQVAATAEREGIPAVLLIGRHREWVAAEEARYSENQGVAITNYTTIFNSNPRLAPPAVIVFDDAHAGEQFVGEQFAVRISRWKHAHAYDTVLDALAPQLSDLLLQRLRSDPDPGAHHQVRLVVPSVDPDTLTGLDAALNALPKPHNFQLAMIRSGLASCMVYLSYGAIEIRPMIPPTFESPLFAGAARRIYLSATLGDGGELERAFGRSRITRLTLPGAAPRSGRRLFVFADAAQGGDSTVLIKSLLRETAKAVVLSQDTVDGAKETALELAPAGLPVFGKDDLEQNLSVFRQAPAGILGLANRYDGLDLPDDDCRVVVLNGLPNAHSLQEKFLSERALAGSALAERVRTRVVQGAGRCTRGPSDYAVVIVSGPDLMQYLHLREVRQALDPELQAEVEFGWLNSRDKDYGEIFENVQVFLEHEEQWREGGEPFITEIRHDQTKVPPPGSAAMQEAAEYEVKAWELAYQEKWIAASAEMERAARTVGKGGEATRGYRAVLLYLAGLWLHHGADGEAARANARKLVRDAEAAAVRGTWLNETPRLHSQPEQERSLADSVAINAIVSRIERGVRQDRYLHNLDSCIDDLSQTEAIAYERGLTTLGEALGATAFKPAGQGRCDSAWLWDSTLWATIEAKSESDFDKTIPLKYIRQTNTQLTQLAADKKADAPPAGSVSVIVSPRAAVEAQVAVTANPDVYMTDPEVVSRLAADVKGAWTALLATSTGGSSSPIREQVARVLSTYGCLPTQILARIATHPIRPLS
ncbi:DEAD/DEAH box helicase [Nocardia jiangxiensis]|uniref:DEAD/DEAH box helicase n=1 Tax=Nocardia jiangxiensis TaxID=282685 RepID=UPI0002DE65C5|nr:DEAD/DEAH box helicase [Nocardia jiangxiensis]